MSTAVYAVAAVVAALAAYVQLRGIADGLRVNRLDVLLSLESEIRSRLHELNDAATEVQAASQNSKTSQKEIARLNSVLNSRLENYLSGVDRLAFCFLNDYFVGPNWRLEYFDYIKKLLESWPNEFQRGSPYTNILDLYEKWKRE